LNCKQLWPQWQEIEGTGTEGRKPHEMKDKGAGSQGSLDFLVQFGNYRFRLLHLAASLRLKLLLVVLIVAFVLRAILSS